MATILEVSALNKYVRSLFDGDPFLDDISVRGEISNFHRNIRSGHCYFTLSDSKSSVKAVMFRKEADRLSFRPENGGQVVARGQVTLYEKEGAYQLYVDALFEDGAGAARSAFEELKEKLLQEGLFAPERKKPLPAAPAKVGLITSKNGAALHDILNVAQRRNPCITFLLVPVSVQGLAAAGEIARAVEKLDALSPDVIILARGGGSMEDLGVFNEEIIARSVFHANTPVVSAIGHEVDFTILDFVADLRAPTPSAAAELVLPDLGAQLNEKWEICRRLGLNIHKRFGMCYNELSGFRSHAAFSRLRARPAEGAARLVAYTASIRSLQKKLLESREKDLAGAARLAATLNPAEVLKRGYAALYSGTAPVTSATQVKVGDCLRLLLRDGEIEAETLQVKTGEEGREYHGEER